MKEYKLGDIVTFHYGKSLPQPKRINGPFPVMSSAGITGWHNEYLVKGPGVIVGRKGSIGTVFYEKRDFFPIDTCYYLTVNTRNILEKKFLYYLLIGSNLKDLNSDAAVPGLNREIAYSQKFYIPDLNIQKKIVAVINNYDNLIENNNRRIAILEDMAQSLYREWFVNFRYPNHENNVDTEGKPKLIDSRLGKIPEGWQVKTAAEVIAINPQTKLPKAGEKPFVGMSGLSESSMMISDIVEKSGNSGAKFINGDTLFARITPCLQNGKTGYVQFLTQEQPIGFGSTEFIVLREREHLSSEFIYLLSRSNDFREHAIQSMTGATGRQRVHNDCFASYYLAAPPKWLMNEFTKLVKPMFKSIFNLSKRNENLKKQRDMLLPKLISGTIKL